MTKTNTKPIVSMYIECQKVQSLSLKPKSDSRNLVETHFPFAFCTLIQDKTNTSSESIVSAQELDVRTYVMYIFIFAFLSTFPFSVSTTSKYQRKFSHKCIHFILIRAQLKDISSLVSNFYIGLIAPLTQITVFGDIFCKLDKFGR